MPAEFNKLGIRFLYPENWTLDEQEALEGNRSVTVYSPGGAFWSIAMHEPNVDPREKDDERIAGPKKPHQFVAVEPRKPGEAKKKKTKAAG